MREGTGERTGPRERRDGEWRASLKMPTNFSEMQKEKRVHDFTCSVENEF